MTKKMLYFHWGFLSDKGVMIEGVPTDVVSSPDGDSSWLPFVLSEFQSRGWKTYGVVDRDKFLVDKYIEKAFESFSQTTRYNAYKGVEFLGLEKALRGEFPADIDLILIYWRMKTRDNQLSKESPNYSPDLEIQEKILDFYKDKNVILKILDFDYQLFRSDEEKIWEMGYRNVEILEQGLLTKKQLFCRKKMYVPFKFEEMLQFATPIPNRKILLSYVGNPYNRDKDIEKITRFAKDNPGRINFFGNWLKDELKEFREKNMEINFYSRIGFCQFRSAIGESCAVPLLATEEYKSNGMMTARIIETLLFGSIPIGFSDFYKINHWLPKELIVKVDDPDSFKEVVDYLSKMNYIDRNKLRKKLIEDLKDRHDVKNFVDILLNQDRPKREIK